MGSLAQLAQSQGMTVTGCDHGIYSPMKEQLQQAGIQWIEGFDSDQLSLDADIYVIGNSMTRGNVLVEAILNSQNRYMSGPQFFADYIVPDKWVLGCAGTHGKTTTSSMLAWVLDYAGMRPGFLIGGVPMNFGVSARMGDSDFFVVEADEYDSAFFDKRSKFVHYRPRTLILNNLEFDHADIFDNINAIQTQFHHLLRTTAGNALVVMPDDQPHLDEVIERGCWSERDVVSLSNTDVPWHARLLNQDGSHFLVSHRDVASGQCAEVEVNWQHSGTHNVNNALVVMAAAKHVGVKPEHSAEALCHFKGVKRRMELLAQLRVSQAELSIYDDFAHHPTAIDSTLTGLRHKVGKDCILAVIEPRSNTMKMGIHQHTLLDSAAQADHCFWYQSEAVDWPMQAWLNTSQSQVLDDIDQLLQAIIVKIDDVKIESKTEDSHANIHVVIMSNGSFDGLHQRLLSLVSNL